MIEYKDISFSVNGESILRNISFSSDAGTITGISGSTSSGKSSLFNITEKKPEQISGSVMLAGKDILSLSSKEKSSLISSCKIGIKETNMESSVYNLVLSGRSGYRKMLSPYSREDRDFTEKTLSTFRLNKIKNEKLKNISQSLQSLSLMAQSFNRDCPILKLQSPDSHLNLDQYSLLKTAIKKYISSGKKSVIIESNNINFLLSICDKLLYLKRGELYRECTPFDIEESLLEYVFSVKTTVSKNIITGRPEVQIIENI